MIWVTMLFKSAAYSRPIYRYSCSVLPIPQEYLSERRCRNNGKPNPDCVRRAQHLIKTPDMPILSSSVNGSPGSPPDAS